MDEITRLLKIVENNENIKYLIGINYNSINKKYDVWQITKHSFKTKTYKNLNKKQAIDYIKFYLDIFEIEY